jgi:Uma2 family endonuclease
MTGSSQASEGDHSVSFDQRVMLHGVSWKGYESLLRERSESKGVRLAYLEGELELMSPSRDHEVRSEMIGLLLMTWADVSGVRLRATGSWTVRAPNKRRGIEADKSYVVGSKSRVPDLAIEVIWTSGGLDKLEIYRGLGVKEVWFWRGGAFEVYALKRTGYERRRRSDLLPQLDLQLMARFVEREDQIAALRSFRAALRSN